jgi:ribosomal peptide maturation radical SAM protein 1
MTVRSEVKVRFVAAPFLPEHQPALGVSSLSAVLAQRGIPTDIKYLNIDYANSIGEELHKYITLANPPNFLLGEMVFTEAVWGQNDRAWKEYLDRVLSAWQEPAYVERQPDNLESLLADVSTLRKHAPAVVRAWAQEILDGMPRIVGFTTTFQQNMASLAVAKEIRRLVPRQEVSIVFGGANCEADMGRAIANHFPFVDYVVSGEGERAIVDLTAAILGGRNASGDQPSYPRWSTGSMIQTMDDLPVPDFDDYFIAVRGSDIGDKANLVAESSRGCWWGMKSHCTFCGLNGQTMQFRSKQPERFASELRTLSKRYGPTYFSIADNILDMKYVRALFPQLAGTNEAITLFYEVKANLRRDHLELMAAGGIVRLQPGIESLSTPILRLMGKGTSRLQNVQLLKWCREFGIEVAWNLLYGFPGEDPAEYDSIAELIPSLCHLQPPLGSGQVRIDRFSPYWRSPEKFDISNLRQFWSYDYVYPDIPEEERINFAYYFDFDHPTMGDPTRYCLDVLKALDRWRQTKDTAELELKRDSDTVVVRDTRGINQEIEYPITRTELRVLQQFDSHSNRTTCLEKLNAGRESAPISQAECNSIIDIFLQRKWLVAEGDQLLSVVVDRSTFNCVVDLRATLQLKYLGLYESPERTSRSRETDAPGIVTVP